MPFNLEEAFSVLVESKWFSVLDLKLGYYQIEMDESDKQKTAFVCPLGFCEFNRMPQGITNAPSTLQRLMKHFIGDLNRKKKCVCVCCFSQCLSIRNSPLLQCWDLIISRARWTGVQRLVRQINP